MRRAFPLLLIPVILALTACTGGYYASEDIENQRDSGSEYDSSEWQAQQGEARVDEYLEENMADRFEATGWSCSYSPTMDDDWHDDAECRNGSEVIRPYLREWDDFVDEAELMESAHEYAAELNAG